MDELDKYDIPADCRGCYENCYRCTRKIHFVSLPVIRKLMAARKLKLQAIVRMQRDIKRIDKQLDCLLLRNTK